MIINIRLSSPDFGFIRHVHCVYKVVHGADMNIDCDWPA